jgi:hypothetical protein
MDIGPGHQYGSAEIGGNATVLQGDAHTSTALNISSGNTIHISVQGNIEWPSVARKRLLLDTEAWEHDVRTVKRKRLHSRGHCEDENLSCEVGQRLSPENRPSRHETRSRSSNAQDQGLREQGVHLVNQILQDSGSGEQVSLSSRENSEIHHVHALQHLRSTLCEDSQTNKGFLLTLVDQVRQNSLFPAIAKVFPNPPAVLQREALHEATMLSSTFDTVAPAREYGSAQDLVCVFLAMLAMLSSREAGHGNNNNNNSALTSPSSKASLIAGLITFAIARYLCVPSMLRQVSEWAGGSLVIQDPFMHELRVPKAHVEHFTLLQAFLRLRLSDTTAEAFIEAGQFNLTLGQRYGRALSKTDWSVKGRIGSGQRVVMSVFLKREDAKCIECEEQLVMSESGQFAW